MLIDTHAHLNFNAYKNDADEVIRRSLDNNVWMINVGSKYETSKRAMEIAEKYEKGVWASVGLHPIHLSTDLVKIKNDTEEVAELRLSPVPRYARPIEIKTKEEESKSVRSFPSSLTERGKAERRSRRDLYLFASQSESSLFDYDKYKELAQNPRVVAIGEVGLDYYWKPKTKKKLAEFKEKQKTVLCQQLKLAEELNLPVIFHCRFAHEDLINILNTRYLAVEQVHYGASKIQNANTGGVVHCFTGTWEQAQKYLEMGFYLGFNGIIFKMDLDEIIKKTPVDKILIETDCPYLTPPQVEGRNEPLHLRYIVQKIAEIKNIDFEKVAEITTQNAKNLFKI